MKPLCQSPFSEQVFLLRKQTVSSKIRDVVRQWLKTLETSLHPKGKI